MTDKSSSSAKKPSRKAMLMTPKDILMMVLFGMALPTWDTYSDVALAYNLISPRCNRYSFGRYMEDNFKQNHTGISFGILKNNLHFCLKYVFCRWFMRI